MTDESSMVWHADTVSAMADNRIRHDIDTYCGTQRNANSLDYPAVDRDAHESQSGQASNMLA